MEVRIELEKRGKNPSQIKELILDNCHSASIVGLTDEFCNLETLSMIDVGLTNLKGFPKLPNLIKLDLSGNRISGGLNNLSCCQKLTSLNLSGNKIDSLEALEPLKELSKLEYLELFNCDVATLDDYKEKVFELLPDLKYLDGLNQNEEAGDSGGENLDDEEEEEEEDEDDNEVGLSYLQNSHIDEESEGDDYSPDDEHESDVDIEDDSEEEASPRGEKRKLENDD